MTFAPVSTAKSRDVAADCEDSRARIIETADAQIGWGAINRKALEPSDIAPTWVHYDVRCYEPKYLGDEMFCTTQKQLDNEKPVRFDSSRKTTRAVNRDPG